MQNNIKKILITGSEGYIGSVLMKQLADLGYEITGYDTNFFRDGALFKAYDNYPLINKDIRDVSEKELQGFDAVIFLAALSNDPLGKINSDLTYDINYTGTIKFAKLAKLAGVKRFIFASSCSLYGMSNDILTEKDKPNPQTAYGKSKILVEEELSNLADDNFSSTFMRNATAYGISSRMRFDIVANNLSGYAHTEKIIKITSDGKAWRPLVHVNDICGAMIAVLKADKNTIHNQAFNVGDSKENYQVLEIANRVHKIYPDCKIEINKNNQSDNRNYNVCFDKLNTILGYKCKVHLDDGIEEMKEIFSKIKLEQKIFEDNYFTRLKQIQFLLKNKMISNDLYWLKDAK